jgi:hypothetical protein
LNIKDVVLNIKKNGKFKTKFQWSFELHKVVGWNAFIFQSLLRLKNGNLTYYIHKFENLIDSLILYFYVIQQLPIQILSTLNSIYAYGENYGFRTHSVDSKNFKIIWKNFHSSITLILVEELMPIDDRVYYNKLDLLFDAMILFYGLDDIINIANIEKFKKEIKVIDSKSRKPFYCWEF